MLAIVSRLFSTLIVGSCFLSVTLFFLSLAASLRMLPKLIGFLMQVLRGLMILSYRLFTIILDSLADPVYRLFIVDLYALFARTIVTTLLSASVGLSIHLLTDLSWSIWIIAGCAIHGILVGLIWDKFLEPGGLMLGINIDEIQ